MNGVHSSGSFTFRFVDRHAFRFGDNRGVRIEMLRGRT